MSRPPAPLDPPRVAAAVLTDLIDLEGFEGMRQAAHRIVDAFDDCDRARHAAERVLTAYDRIADVGAGGRLDPTRRARVAAALAEARANVDRLRPVARVAREAIHRLDAAVDGSDSDRRAALVDAYRIAAEAGFGSVTVTPRGRDSPQCPVRAPRQDAGARALGQALRSVARTDRRDGGDALPRIVVHLTDESEAA